MKDKYHLEAPIDVAENPRDLGAIILYRRKSTASFTDSLIHVAVMARLNLIFRPISCAAVKLWSSIEKHVNHYNVGLVNVVAKHRLLLCLLLPLQRINKAYLCTYETLLLSPVLTLNRGRGQKL